MTLASSCACTRTLGIYTRDPFQSLDQEGVGELVRIAIRKGRAVKPMLKLGICGEHGGDPRTIEFCHRSGLNYVSCSPLSVCRWPSWPLRTPP